jgi:hypothetical protein
MHDKTSLGHLSFFFNLIPRVLCFYIIITHHFLLSNLSSLNLRYERESYRKIKSKERFQAFTFHPLIKSILNLGVN